MTDEIEIVYGSGNVLDGQKISVGSAHNMTGFAAADFSRVRQGKLARFTFDRLMAMLDQLD
jgi:Helix-turn-helix domain